MGIVCDIWTGRPNLNCIRRLSVILCCLLFWIWIQSICIDILTGSHHKLSNPSETLNINDILDMDYQIVPISTTLSETQTLDWVFNNYNLSNQIETPDNDETKHVAFMKIHKTGSSTIQNIFIRFGDSRNLTFILGRVSKAKQECRGWSSCISLYKTLSDDVIVPPPRDQKYDILCSHVIYNKQMFLKYLPPDTKLIASVREPVKRLESAIAHFNLVRDANLSTYTKDPHKYDHPMLNNGMAFEFGFDKYWFPSVNKKYINDTIMSQVMDYLTQIMTDFHLILISERLDESLVLMKRQLQWRTEDILYANKLVRIHRTFSTSETKELREYLYLDYILYNTALQSFEDKVANAGSDFIDEVTDFKIVRSKVLVFCASATSKTSLVINRSPWYQRFVVTKKLCKDLRRKEYPYLNFIRRKQYGTLDTL